MPHTRRGGDDHTDRRGPHRHAAGPGRVYYCVDDFSKWPGLDQEPLGRMERQLVVRADEVIAVSDNLQERLAGLGRESHLLTHGVDLEHWARTGTPPPPELEPLRRPLIVFSGRDRPAARHGFLKRLADDLAGARCAGGPRARSRPGDAGGHWGASSACPR